MSAVDEWRRTPSQQEASVSLLTAARVRAAVSALVARARPDHPAVALRALDCVFPRVEERGLAGGRGWGRLGGVRDGAAVLVRLGQAPADFLAQDAELLLILNAEDFLPRCPPLSGRALQPLA